jgi:Uncharacterised protein family (UPF0158)
LAVVISLREVIEALDLQSDELSSYLDPDSGEIITFNREQADIAKRGDWQDQPDWMRAVLPRIKRALQNGRMLPLPDRAHIDEWRIMQDFAEKHDDCNCRAVLSSAAHGNGAFRHFQAAIEQLGIEEQWTHYRDQAMDRVARQWLDDNNLRYR